MSAGRQIISLQPYAKEAMVRLAVILTPVVGKPATYSETMVAAERIVRAHLKLAPVEETNLEDATPLSGLSA